MNCPLAAISVSIRNSPSCIPLCLRLFFLYGSVAQLAERLPLNQFVASSTLVGAFKPVLSENGDVIMQGDSALLSDAHLANPSKRFMVVGRGGRIVVECQYPWPSMFIQGCDSSDLKNGSLLKAFVECFPEEPSCYLRGEGATLAESEQNCWAWYQRVVDGHEHIWDSRGREDGYGYCSTCHVGMSDVLPVTQKCALCDSNKVWGSAEDGRKLCAEHWFTIDILQLNRYAQSSRARFEKTASHFNRPYWTLTDEDKEIGERRTFEEEALSEDDICRAIGDVLRGLADAGTRGAEA